ncbi:magnesium chelatase [Candidatus Bathyarchaeota archaeon RBG_13_60_20]|nr:MAG: magnesium chelatase [Candidatus Bathyarchaeota archaeon RBG_13_60_20]
MHVDQVKAVSNAVLEGLGKVYVGKRMVLRKLLAASLANGHVLFEDYPGLGKTLLAKLFSRITGCGWSRVQFTPDLMPADILGTRVWKQQQSQFVLERGPIFTNVLLADEINRAPPKTQAGLLEAMEERQVTIEGETHKLAEPFFVIATQNPIEMEGTYPLPEAQMDRFLIKMSMGYVETLAQESLIMKRRIFWKQDDPTGFIQPVTNEATFKALQKFIEEQIYVDDKIIDYISQIIRETRRHPVVEVGASPRGGLAILKVARAHAAITGRSFVTPDDVKMFVHDALGHRIIMKMEYVLEGSFSVEAVLNEILEQTEVPKEFVGKR